VVKSAEIAKDVCALCRVGGVEGNGGGADGLGSGELRWVTSGRDDGVALLPGETHRSQSHARCAADYDVAQVVLCL
jgi:hypothetical protein